MSTEGDGYKEVQLGPKKTKIPSIWDYSDLGSQCEIYQPETITEQDMIEDGPYKVFGANGVIGFYSKYNHKDHQVLVTCRGATCGTVNFSEKKSWITGNAMVVKPNKSSKISKHFLRYYLEKSNLKGAITGSAQPQITKSSLSVFLVPLPPKMEQKKIAEVLSTVDDAIQKTDEIIERAKELKKGLMQDLLTKGIGHDEFKEVQLGPRSVKIPSEWKCSSLDSVAEITSSKRVMKADYVDEGMPFYRSKEIIEKSKGGDISDPYYISEEHFLDFKNKYGAPEEGDILITSVGTLGVPYLVQDEEFYFKDGNLLWMKNIDSIIHRRYLIQFLKGREFQLQILQMTYGSTQKALAVKNLKRARIFVPKYSEQEKIAKVLSNVDEEIQQEQNYKEKLEKLKKGLMQDLLTGKVRVLSLLSEEEKEELEKADVTG